MKKRASYQETKLHKAHQVLTVIPKETVNQETIHKEENTESLQGLSREETKDVLRNRHSKMVQNNETNQKQKKTDTLHNEVHNKITNQKASDQLTGMEPSRGDRPNVENLMTKTTTLKETRSSIREPRTSYRQESSNVNMQLDHKERGMEISKSTIAKVYMTPTMPQRESLKNQKVRGQKTDLEQPKSDTDHKQPSNKSEHNRWNKRQQETELRKQHKNVPMSQTGITILKTDYKKPVGVSRDDLGRTTVIVEHAKVNCTSLADVRSVRRHSQRVTKCLLAEEVETWEV
ncbi:uncharacterized protein [Dendropsophus ebraccatus]|uniref:uncharacterized protein n=1 Tax=Dendropsophus ebraccatus TaxID=150705 RepID=UPI0038318327